MGPWPVLVCLAAVLQPSATLLLTYYAISNSPPSRRWEGGFSALSTARPETQNTIVQKHNFIRQSVSPTASNMLTMEWNPEAATNAQIWAEKMQDGHQLHQGQNQTTCGENTLESNYTTSWNDTIFFWQKEQLSFKYGLGVIKPYSEIASYTQMIWYSSYEIGCGVAYCPSSLYKYFYVCHYCPAGNNQDMLAFPYKAGAPCADCWKNCHHGLCTNACKRSDKFSNCVALKEKLTCNFPAVRENCKASCQCSSDIK
uniref:ShKT domain-containing protein n=1 Tax=Ornithorhynchus anatinus TaxID=9258 RepID=F6ZDI6_ORNAN